jgi:hypothetical protein
MSTELLPYSFPTELEAPTELTPLPGGESQGVYFTLPEDLYEDLLARVEGWFADRDEVAIVDYGTTDKQGLGYIMIEWQDYEIDPLFLAILRDEDLVEDYTVYSVEVA